MNGGGIFNYTGPNPTSTLTVTNSTLSGNTATEDGGAICNDGAMTLTNSTLSGNTASNDGGGIRNNASSATLNNTLVAGNVASTESDISGKFVGIYNLIGNGAGQTSLVNGVDGNIVGTFETPIDPLLGQLQDNGGPTLTQYLQPESPAINAGNDAKATGPLGQPLVTDQRGFQRHFGTVDIGAVEVQPPGVPVAYDDFFDLDQGDSFLLDVLANDFCINESQIIAEIVSDPRHGTLVDNLDGTMTYTPEGTFWGNDTFSYRVVNGSFESNVAEVILSVVSPLSIVVTTAVDEQDGDLSSNDISLREALVDLAGSQIQFASNLSYQKIVLARGAFDVSDVRIVGLGSHLLSISGSGTVFNVTSGDSTLSQMQVTGGQNIVVATEATLLIDQMIVSNSNSNSRSGIDNSGSLTITNSTISNNKSFSNGGGIYNRGTLKATNFTFSDNTAFSAGGGIYNSGGKMAIANCTFSGNSAQQGGGIYTTYGKLTITNCTLSANSASFSGGGIYIFGSSAATILNNTIIAGNMAMQGLDIKQFSGTLSGVCNLIGNGSGQSSFVNGVNGNIVGTFENPIDPLFVLNPSRIDDYGDLQLAYGSPAINGGSNELAVDADGNPLVTDIDGNPRIINGTVDIGAYESSEPARLPGDANLDKTVNNADALIVSGNWLMQSGATWADGDFNGDGRVDSIDATLMAANLQTTPDPPATSSTVATEPEPEPVSFDLDNDGKVDLGDLALFASVYREKPGITTESPYAYAADFDLSGTVDLGDLALFASSYQLSRSDASLASTAEVSQSSSTAPETALTMAKIPAEKTAILLPGDANLDGTVNDDDAGSLVANWQKQSGVTWAEGDFNSDGRVDDADASLLAMHWLMNDKDLDDDSSDCEKDAAHDQFFDAVV